MKMKRAKNPMPGFVSQALEQRNLVIAYEERPPYQQNDYLGWINDAKQQSTKDKRLAQMLEELELGGVYMKMPHPPSSKSWDLRESTVMKTRKDTNRDGTAEVDIYIQELSPNISAAIELHRVMIKKAAPECSERIAYGMPVFRQGTDLCGIKAHKSYCSFYTMDTELAEQLAYRFDNIEVSNSTIHFYPDKPLPYELIDSVIKAKL